MAAPSRQARSGVRVSSWSLLIRGSLAALRQELHLSTCPNLASHLYRRADFADALRALAAVTASCRLALVHGDVSPKNIAAGGACNAALIKPNQAGTVNETIAALEAARRAVVATIISARSGETDDTTLAHLAVGWNCGQLKVGSFARFERMAK